MTDLIPGLDFVPDVMPAEEPAQEPTLAEIEAALAAEAVAEPPLVEPEAQAPEVSLEDAFAFGAIPEADLDAIPAPPVAESTPSPESFTPSGDFEADLRSLGLGELPEELLQSEAPIETRLPMSELEPLSEVPESRMAPEGEVLPEPILETEPQDFAALEAESEAASALEAEAEFELLTATELEAQPEPALEAEPADQDLDSLLASLESTSAEGVISSGTDYGPEAASEGVISTDAFLAEFDDVGLSAGLGDELTALTGGASGRSRPVATVAKLPEAGETRMLHRDQMVDRALLEKIIEGVENL